MKKYLIFGLACGLAVFTSCGDKEDEHSDDDVDAITQQSGMQVRFASFEEGDSVKSYGKAITSDSAIKAEDLASSKTADDFEGKVTGTVVAVCQNKGCWMKLDVGNGQTMMVTFKDYGFFVPKDIAGKTVIVDGTADMKTVSVEEQRHYAEDAGKPKEEIQAIKEEKVELSFEAAGVLVIE